MAIALCWTFPQPPNRSRRGAVIRRPYRPAPALAALAAAVLCCAFGAAAQVSLAGGIVAFSGGGSDRVYSPSLVFTSDGGAAMVWEGSEEGLVRQALLATGLPAGSRAAIASHELPDALPYRGPVVLQREPATVALEAGRTLTVWVEETQHVEAEGLYSDARILSSNVVARRFDHQARPIGRRFALHGPEAPSGAAPPAQAPWLESSPTATRLSSGRVAVVWHATEGDRPAGVYGRILNGRGVPLGEAFRVDDGAGPGVRPTIAPAARGGFVVAWQGCCDAGSDQGIFVRTFSRTGEPSGAGRVANEATAGDQIWPVLARGAGGSYLLAWMSTGFPESGLTHRIVGRPLDRRARPTGPQRWMSQGPGTAHGAPALAAVADGYAVAWTSWVGGFTTGIHAGAVDAGGVPRGGAIEVSEGPVRAQWRLGLAVDHEARLLAAWQGYDRDGGSAIEVRALRIGAGGARSVELDPAP